MKKKTIYILGGVLMMLLVAMVVAGYVAYTTYLIMNA